jgi:histidinol-phosphate aminotransferase
VSHEYERLPDPGEGLRLHLNENTGGCSPAVVSALRALDAEQIAFYPDYAAVSAECAAFFGVKEDELVLTNGLDEGILAAAVAATRGRAADAEVLIVEPAFDMYAAAADAVGAKIVAVEPGPDLEFPYRDVLRRLARATRLVFLTNPTNPTGRPIPVEAIRKIAIRAPRALIFIDEAYAEFSGASFVSELHRWPSVLVGRTFAKAYGLAALRAGAVLGQRDTLASVRRVVPPYSLNIAAVAALRAAIRDKEHASRYLAEVDESKRLFYAACDRLGLKYWNSAANFVLVDLGSRASAVVSALAQRRIFVRDRSRQPGCAGCVRVTTGLVDHTRACIAALEEILCAAP